MNYLKMYVLKDRGLINYINMKRDKCSQQVNNEYFRSWCLRNMFLNYVHLQISERKGVNGIKEFQYTR